MKYYNDKEFKRWHVTVLELQYILENVVVE